MATVISSQPRHVLTPLSPRKRTVLGNVTNIVRGLDAALDKGAKQSLTKKPLGLSSSPGKRPFYTIYDENAPVNATTQTTKRMKSHLSPLSCDENSLPKYTLVTKPASPAPSSTTVSTKKKAATGTSLKRRARTQAAAAASLTGSPRSALSRKDSLASLSSPSKGIKRKIQKTVRRVDPPSHLSKKDIDATSSSSIDGRLIATPVAKSGNASGATWRPGQNFPKSWMFDIHEDTLEETLTNLMYHGAGTLDISDEEDFKKKCEVDRVGKENIPPPPSEDQLAMPPPPRRDEPESFMDSERIRSPLGEADVEIFYPNLKKEREEAELLKKMKQEEKRAGMMASKFAVIGDIVEDYLKQQKDNSDVLDPAAIPLPPSDDEDEENTPEEADENKKSTKDVKGKAKIPTISVSNCDFDDAIDTQTRGVAEDELFNDDL